MLLHLSLIRLSVHQSGFHLRTVSINGFYFLMFFIIHGPGDTEIRGRSTGEMMRRL